MSRTLSVLDAASTALAGATLRGKAGPLAIAVNDLVLQSQHGQLFPVKNADYAAAAPIGSAPCPNTAVSAYSSANQCRKSAIINPADGNIFIATAYFAPNYGFQIYKYSPLGVLLASRILETSQTDTNSSPIISQLSNGNLAVTWVNSTSFALKFMVLDTNLNIIKANTAIATCGNDYYDAIPLSAGGFAVSYMGGTSAAYLAIYDNSGTVVFAGAAISNSPVGNVVTRLAQQSGGNIVIAINSSTASKCIGHAINTITGTQVLAYVALDAISGSGNLFPELAVIAGYYCLACGDGTNTKAYVLNNAGALQGGAYSRAQTSAVNKLLTDGTAFWLFQYGTTAMTAYIPATGTGFVETAGLWAAQGLADAVIDNGYIVVASPSAIYTHQILAGGNLSYVATVTPTIGSVTSLKAAGDLSVLAASAASTTAFAVQKYMSSAIVGVSQVAVAAGNAGNAVTYSIGPSAYLTNTVLGSNSKSFSHAGGNKGVITNTSAYLFGINARQNIN